MSEVEWLRSIDGRLATIERLATEITGSMVTVDECQEKHRGAFTAGAQIVMAIVAIAAVFVAYLK